MSEHSRPRVRQIVPCSGWFLIVIGELGECEGVRPVAAWALLEDDSVTGLVGHESPQESLMLLRADATPPGRRFVYKHEQELAANEREVLRERINRDARREVEAYDRKRRQAKEAARLS